MKWNNEVMHTCVNILLLSSKHFCRCEVVIFDALIKNEGNNGTSYLTILQNKDTELIYHLR